MKYCYIAVLWMFYFLTHPVMCDDSFSATGNEIIGYEAHVQAGDKFLSIFGANLGGIKTWQGHVNATKKAWKSPKREELLYHLEYDIDFQCDNVLDKYRYVAEQKYLMSSLSGDTKEFPLRKEAVIVTHDNNTSMPLVYFYGSWVRQPDELKAASELKIGHDLEGIQMYFNPLSNGLPSTVQGITDIFDVFDIEKLRESYKKDGMQESRIKELIDKVKENGFPSHWKLSSKDQFLYFDGMNGSHYTWDLNRGAWTTFYKSGTRKWNCDLQKISSVWIPQKILVEYEDSNSLFWTEESIWTSQKINSTIDDLAWTITSLGARRGDLGFDARTDTTFRVTGDEFLPSIEEEEALESISGKPRNTFFRILFIGVGLLLILIGGFNIIRNKMKKTF